MATAIFQGASSDWDDTDNWTGGAGAGGVPANNDTVIIGDTSQDLDTNLTTGLTGITLRIGPNYTGQIGTASTFLDLDGGTLDYESGASSCYLTGTWTTVNVRGGQDLTFKANASTDIGTLRVIGGTGTITVGSNAVLDDLEVLGAPFVKVVVASAVTSCDNITQDSGVVEFSPSGGLAVKARVIGGKLEVKDAASITTLEIDGSGSVVYNASGNITTLTVYNGKFDARLNPNQGVTVTNCTLYGGSCIAANGLGGVAFSNPITFQGPAVLIPEPGSTLTVA